MTLRVLALWHRYLGMTCCLFFAMWFATGIVMMYAQMPALTEGERLDALPVVPFDRMHIGPVHAVELAALGSQPRSVTISTLFGRPVYRIKSASGRLTTVFADDGEVATRFDFGAASRSLEPYLARRQGSCRFAETLTDPDQWTVSGDLDAYRPFYRVSVDDGAGTNLYLSSISGDVVLVTTTRSRMLAWFGAIPHWLYVTALRRHAELWRRVVMVIAGLGCAVCLLGVTVGVLRYSPSKRYRRRERPPSHSPYEGVMRWHHWSGLTFGAITLAWVFSGLLTLDPGRFSHGTAPSPQDLRAYEGGDFDVRRFDRAPTLLAQAIGPDRHVKEVALAQVDGRPFYRLRDQSGGEVTLDSRGALAPPFDEEALVRLAHRAMPTATITDVARLSEYDAYYYDRDARRPLPILRVKFDDPGATWLYVDSAAGSPVGRIDRAARAQRWLSDGLHRMDFPFLWSHRPQWDMVTIALSAGGLALSVTAIVIAFKRLRALARSSSAPTSSDPATSSRIAS